MVISVIFLIKAVYTHELIQHAITETADEMASTGYILHISGLGDLNSELDSGIKKKAETFKAHIDTVFDSFGDFNGLENTVQTTEDVAASPVDELKNAACLLAGGVYGDIKTSLFTPMAKLYMEKYLVSGSNLSPDNKLRALNIIGGMNGLDFDESDFFMDENNDINIVVKYKINLPVPIKLLPQIQIVQKVSAKAWMGGDESAVILGEN